TFSFGRVTREKLTRGQALVPYAPHASRQRIFLTAVELSVQLKSVCLDHYHSTRKVLEGSYDEVSAGGTVVEGGWRDEETGSGSVGGVGYNRRQLGEERRTRQDPRPGHF